jgi:peptide/nickel transport system ATP-binding protein
MQQRVMLSLALAADPDLIIADEATTALDVTIQAQIVELLLRLRRERGLTIIFITHDLGLVAEICDYVAVLYMGRIVEEGDTDSIFHDTRHPYTRGLLSALPSDKTWGTPLTVIPGSVPTATNVAPGCSFAPRCSEVMEVCQTTDPRRTVFTTTHSAECHLYSSNQCDRRAREMRDA